MRVTIRIPDDLGREVKARTDNVSAYVQEALTEKLAKEKRRGALDRIAEAVGTYSVDADIHKKLQEERRKGDRT